MPPNLFLAKLAPYVNLKNQLNNSHIDMKMKNPIKAVIQYVLK